ncbi:MAG TPA: FliH/SctL family protein [Bryobacteraceae bacterium]|nr:FliH/SctL family protein [Bryobacteraceae bacterium]
MSSRLYRPEDGVEAAPIQWRPAGAPPTHHIRARNADPGKPVPEALASESRQEAEARARAAYHEGLAAGEAAAQHRAQQKLEPSIQAFNALLAELASMRKRVRAEAEDDAVKLAVAIARRVIYRELSADPEAILGLVKAAFGKLSARETHRVRMAPSDAAVLESHRAKLQIPPGLEIAADNSLPPGSAVFETTRGELDASVDTQLAEIDRGLADVLRRRK